MARQPSQCATAKREVAYASAPRESEVSNDTPERERENLRIGHVAVAADGENGNEDNDHDRSNEGDDSDDSDHDDDITARGYPRGYRCHSPCCKVAKLLGNPYGWKKEPPLTWFSSEHDIRPETGGDGRVAHPHQAEG